MAKCFQDDIKEFPWTPERMASLWTEAKRLIDNGADLEETTKSLSASLGLRREVILDALARRPKGVSRAMTQEMWERQANRRSVENQARAMVSEMQTPQWRKTASTITSIPRRVLTVGHFTVFPKTHMGDLLLTDPKTFLRTFGRSMRLISREGIAQHQQRMLAMTLDPDYGAAVRAGVDVQPGGGEMGGFRGATKEMLGSAKEKRSAMAFDELRLARFQIFKNAMSKLAPEERTIDNL